MDFALDIPFRDAGVFPATKPREVSPRGIDELSSAFGFVDDDPVVLYMNDIEVCEQQMAAVTTPPSPPVSQPKQTTQPFATATQQRFPPIPANHESVQPPSYFMGPQYQPTEEHHQHVHQTQRAQQIQVLRAQLVPHLIQVTAERLQAAHPKLGSDLVAQVSVNAVSQLHGLQSIERDLVGHQSNQELASYLTAPHPKQIHANGEVVPPSHDLGIEQAITKPKAGKLSPKDRQNARRTDLRARKVRMQNMRPDGTPMSEAEKDSVRRVKNRGSVDKCRANKKAREKRLEIERDSRRIETDLLRAFMEVIENAGLVTRVPDYVSTVPPPDPELAALVAALDTKEAAQREIKRQEELERAAVGIEPRKRVQRGTTVKKAGAEL